MRIYIKERVCPFRFTNTRWGAFSNFQPLAVPILAGPWSCPTSENLYQACKFPAHPDVQQRTAEAPTARQAAAIGRTPGLGIDPGWNAQRVDVMRWVLRMKREAERGQNRRGARCHRRAPHRRGLDPRPLVGGTPRRRPLRGAQRPRPIVDGTAPAASRSRSCRALRHLDRPHPRRPSRRRRPSRAGRAAERPTAFAPTTADRARPLPRAGERGGRSGLGEPGR